MILYRILAGLPSIEKCADLCYEYNMCKPSDVDRQLGAIQLLVRVVW